MRVLMNALGPRLGGTLTYTQSLLSAFARVRPDWETLVLANPSNANYLGGIPGVNIQEVHVPLVGHRVLFEQLILPRRARGFDVMCGLANFAPVLQTRTPSVIILHNSRYFGVGREVSHSGLRIRLEALLARRSVRKADRVVVISRSLLSELEHDDLASSRCEVILSGAPELADHVEKPPGMVTSGPFFVSVANDYEHKRLGDLVAAWAPLPRAAPALVLAGRISADRIDDLRNLVHPDRRSDLLLLGPMAEPSQVRWLYENALAMVSTSELEACPLAPGEAGAAGCPMILSDIPPHREVSEGRGSYFPARDVAALTRSLAEACAVPPPRERWAWPMTWEQNAEQLATLLEGAARTPRPGR